MPIGNPIIYATVAMARPPAPAGSYGKITTRRSVVVSARPAAGFTSMTGVTRLVGREGKTSSWKDPSDPLGHRFAQRGFERPIGTGRGGRPTFAFTLASAPADSERLGVGLGGQVCVNRQRVCIRAAAGQGVREPPCGPAHSSPSAIRALTSDTSAAVSDTTDEAMFISA